MLVGRRLLSLSKTSEAVRAFGAPIARWSPRLRLVAGIVAIAVCLADAAYNLLTSESVYVLADAPFYLAIAKGDNSQLLQPFASRQLGALLVKGLAQMLHWTVERGFVVEGVASLVFMVAAVYFLVLRGGPRQSLLAPRWMLLAIAIVPFWGTLLQYLVLPDLWYSALIAGLLLLIANEQMLPAALMMFPLMVSRESTSLVLICFLIACWSALRWRDRIVAVVATVAGAAVVSHLAKHAQSNVEHLPQSVYMLAKVPWNFLHNILGIVPWSNVYPDLCKVPAWSVALHAGPVRAVGVCGFSGHSWFLLVLAVLSSFGLLPLLVAFLWWRRDRLAKRSLLLKFTLLYGGVSLALTPLLGIWFVHLIGYAWPLFLVALPLLFDEQAEGGRPAAGVAFFCVHAAACWVSYRWMWWPQITVEAGLWVVGFLLVRAWLGPPPTPPLLSLSGSK
jgi:hypothetical protein